MEINELKSFHGLLCSYRFPEELFKDLKGNSKDEQEKDLKEKFRNYVVKYHPDKNIGDPLKQYYAGEITSILNGFYSAAEQKISLGKYGVYDFQKPKDSIFEIVTKNRTYRIIEMLAEGNLAKIYLAEYNDERGLTEKVSIKVANSQDENDLLANEVRILNLLKHKSLPFFIENFKTTERQNATVYRFIEGYDFFSIREKYPKGVPQEHICWIMERLLSVLGFMHSNKIIHGNIEPGNILVRPEDHNAFLIDFTFSIPEADKPNKKYSGFTEDFSAPEIIQKKSPIPHSDIFSLGKSIIFLLGGDVKTDSFPSAIDDRLRNFILQMVNPSTISRLRDAWGSWHSLRNLRKNIFGSKQFIEFKM